MNHLGKIFTVAIMVASVFLMAVALMVFSTHRNWRDAYTQLDTRFQAAQTEKRDLQSRYEKDIQLLQAEQSAAQQDVSKLRGEREMLISELNGLQRQNDALQQDQRANVAMVTAAGQNNANLTEEVKTLRGNILQAMTDRDDAFVKTTEATTDLHVAAGRLEQSQERNEQLVEQVAHQTALLTSNGIDPGGAAVPRVRGEVSGTLRQAGVQLIVITIGADDGVKPQQTVEVFRGTRYLGRAEIIKVDPDRAVGRVMREYQQGQIQEGDDVATKLRVG